MNRNDNSRKTRNALTAVVPTLAVPGSQPLRDRIHEQYARHRAQALPRIDALQHAAHYSFRKRTTRYTKGSLHTRSWQLERDEKVRQRIQYLTQDAVALVAAKRARLEERLWSMHEADIGEFFEQQTIEKDGEVITIDRPRRLTEIDPETRKNIEKITIDGRGRAVPQLYSKLQASQELRKMLEIGKTTDEVQLSRLSDAELIKQLADQAKQLGVDINLNYSFVEGAKEPEVRDPSAELTGLAEPEPPLDSDG